MTHTAPIRTIAVLGAGNGGCAAAADLTERGFSVRLYSRTEATIAPLRARGGVEYEGVLGEGLAPLPVITTDAAAAMAGADLVILMVPTHAHESVAGIAGDHLKPDQLLLAAPGHTMLLIPRVLRRLGIQRPRHAETGTLPYICRMAAPGRVRITKASEHIVFGVFPAAETDAVTERMRHVFPAIKPAPNILHTVFPYTNAIHHPPATICNVGRMEATGGDYCHYYEGITPSVGRLIDALDRERVAVAAALGATVDPFVEHFYKAGYTTAAARDAGLAYEAFHQSEPDRWIRAPASLEHRFLHEDVPYGLVPLAELGRLAGVPTPTMDHVIQLASVATGRDYRASGLTLVRMGLAGLSRPALHRLLMEGYGD
jgi:opine dehydrogenase